MSLLALRTSFLLYSMTKSFSIHVTVLETSRELDKGRFSLAITEGKTNRGLGESAAQDVDVADVRLHL